MEKKSSPLFGGIVNDELNLNIIVIGRKVLLLIRDLQCANSFVCLENYKNGWGNMDYTWMLDFLLLLY